MYLKIQKYHLQGDKIIKKYRNITIKVIKLFDIIYFQRRSSNDNQRTGT